MNILLNEVTQLIFINKITAAKEKQTGVKLTFQVKMGGYKSKAVNEVDEIFCHNH